MIDVRTNNMYEARFLAFVFYTKYLKVSFKFDCTFVIYILLMTGFSRNWLAKQSAQKIRNLKILFRKFLNKPMLWKTSQIHNSASANKWCEKANRNPVWSVVMALRVWTRVCPFLKTVYLGKIVKFENQFLLTVTALSNCFNEIFEIEYEINGIKIKGSMWYSTIWWKRYSIFVLWWWQLINVQWNRMKWLHSNSKKS